MSIEDIDYLLKNSKKETYMFMVDSNNRDKILYPTPSNYTINFSSPFKMVYSLDVIDASIPRTQYSIDDHNNSLSIIQSEIIGVTDNTQNLINTSILNYENDKNNYFLRSDFTESFTKTYDNSQRIKMLNGSTSLGDYLDTNFPLLNSNFNSTFTWHNYYTGTPFTSYTIPSADYSDTTFITNFNSTLEPINVKISNLSTPGNLLSTFQLYSIQPFILDTQMSSISTVLGFNMFADPSDTSKYTYIHNQVFKSFLSNDYEYTKTYTGPIAIGTTTTINPSETLSFTFTPTTSGYFYSIQMSFDFSSNGSIGWSLSDTSGTLISSRIDITPNVIYKESILSDTSIYLDPSVTYTFSLHTPRNSDSLDAPIIVQTQDSIPCIDIMISNQLYKIIAPGMYSLMGDRYTMLRCPEIESHLYRSRAFESYNMGLAKFKLSVLGYDESRFDFSTIPPREFHPIGKLTHLSFKFERPDGTLYNFRGINHTITLCLRYLSPIQLGSFDKYILNPGYDPDFFRYQQNENSDSDSDSDSDNDSIKSV